MVNYQCPACGGEIAMTPAGTALPHGRCKVCGRSILVNYLARIGAARVSAYDAPRPTRDVTPVATHDEPFPSLYGSGWGSMMINTPHPLTAGLLAAFPALVAAPPGRGSVGLCVTDPDAPGARGADPEEAAILALLVGLCRPWHALEIGSYVGWTAAHIAAALRPGGRLDCVDDGSEANAAGAFAANLERAGLSGRVRYWRASSPECLSVIAPRAGWDFAFVDGSHIGGAPVRDVVGLLPHLSERACVALHDAYLPDVQGAVEVLRGAGWHVVVLPTTNALAVGVRV